MLDVILLITKCLFLLGVRLRQISISIVHGGGLGWLSYLCGVKRGVLVSLSMFSLKWVTAKDFEKSFRVLIELKKICQEIFDSFAIVSIAAIKILKVSINVLL